MSSYSIGADSPRWWWLTAATGAAGAAAIAAILVLPADSASPPGEVTSPDLPQPTVVAPRFSRLDPAVGPPCFRRLPRAEDGLDLPRCGRQSSRGQRPFVDGLRPDLDTGP